jgi:hypothetical protein
MRQRFGAPLNPAPEGVTLKSFLFDFLTLVRYKADLYLVLRMRTAPELKRGRFLF